jgi:Icc-related predicted phosphoesterase
MKLKVLVVADKVVDFIYSPCLESRMGDVDLVLSCGDLPYYYLEYIVSILNKPLLYVHGNHDSIVEYCAGGMEIRGPGGGINTDGRLVKMLGLSVVGLEGSLRYKPMGQYQYSDWEMWAKSLALVPSLLMHRVRTGKPPDIMLAHAPPFGIHNGQDRAHIGFRAFLWLMQKFRPRYLIHGHRHVYNPLETTETQFEDTLVINAYPYKVIEIEV